MAVLELRPLTSPPAGEFEPIYDATLFDQQNNLDGDPDTGPLAYYLGTILPGMTEMIDMPAFFPGDQLFIEGALAEGGPMEMFEGDYQISEEDGGGAF